MRIREISIQDSVGVFDHPISFDEKPSTCSTSNDFSEGNERRIELIKKKVNESLSLDEQNELDKLQAQMRVYVNNKYPLPFTALEQLEKVAQEMSDRTNTQ